MAIRIERIRDDKVKVIRCVEEKHNHLSLPPYYASGVIHGDGYTGKISAVSGKLRARDIIDTFRTMRERGWLKVEIYRLHGHAMPFAERIEEDEHGALWSVDLTGY